MDVSKSILKGLDEAIKFQEGKIKARKVTISVKPVERFTKEQIKQIRNEANLTQHLFASTLAVTKKAVEAWERGTNRPSGPSLRLLQLFKDNPEILKSYIVITNEYSLLQ